MANNISFLKSILNSGNDRILLFTLKYKKTKDITSTITKKENVKICMKNIMLKGNYLHLIQSD